MWAEGFLELCGAAARQQGLVTSAQARRIGVDDAAVGHLADAGLLVELDWDVHQVAGSVTAPRYAYPYAAWLAISPELFAWERPTAVAEDAVLSHESACALYGLAAPPAPTMVFTAGRDRPAPRAIRVHVAPLTPADVAVHRGVPVTTPERTVLDLVRDGTAHATVGRVIADAVRLDLVDLADLHAAVAPLAALPVDGAGFVEYLAPWLGPGLLSPRNLRAYAHLRFPDRVAMVRAEILPVTGAGELGWDVAAEIVARRG
ncbi:hypothetical protein [Plantactinospora sp. WMMB782]|uniref:hypothetical protein n=1 Tax=Plantactinospora sp. WMMB782 TaxID=3404121 RepID=UPI003B95A393